MSSAIVTFRKARFWALLLCLGFGWAAAAEALSISSRYSPENRKRPRRKHTRYIVLHTTEGPAAGSLKKLYQRGETHYFVDTNGHVTRIIHRSRVAFHAGRSMWNGLTDLDRVSLGIEVVGYHNRPITEAQVRALSALLAELQRIYRVPDERVLTHSMVAYGTPNAWHRHSHRGRKRCGMLFAQRSLRLRLGLQRQPLYDPDVRAGRLKVGDPYLARVLYGSAREQVCALRHYAASGGNVIGPGRSAWDIARDAYNSPSTVYVFPDGTRRTGDRIRDWRAMPSGTRVELDAGGGPGTAKVLKTLGRDGASPGDIAGAEHRAATTIYFLTDGRVRRGDELSDKELAGLAEGTRLLVGYVHGGYVTDKRPAYAICGPRWRHASTIYRLSDGSLVSGDRVSEGAIPKGTMVFFRR